MTINERLTVACICITGALVILWFLIITEK